MYKHLLIPTDGSPLSEMTIQQGMALAQATQAKVTGLTVLPRFETAGRAAHPGAGTTRTEYESWCDTRANTRLERIARAAQQAGVTYDLVHVFNDLPYDGIIRSAQERGCDLIVMAAPSREGLSALVLGSETTRVLAYSKIPVLVCR